MTADYEAADMVHRNRLGLAREAAAASTVDVLNAENKALTRELRMMKEAYGILRGQLTVATCAALAANEYYRAEYMGEKTYLTPTETRERFGSAMVAYREATGADEPTCVYCHHGIGAHDNAVPGCSSCGCTRVVIDNGA